MSENQDCLAGIKVLDLSRYESGPSCTATLAWLGAEVVKIESPGKGDPGRGNGSTAGVDGIWFQQWNANKKSITVDLKSAVGLGILNRIIREADVFVENLAPGAIERLGLGYEAVRTINPGLIYAQIKGFGEGSPYESNPSYDMIGQATGGSMSVTGERNGPPIKPGTTVADCGSGMALAVSIIAALYRRKCTGKGARLQVAMQDVVMHFLRGAFSDSALTRREARRNGAKSAGGIVNVPSSLYPCRPGGPNDYVYIYAHRNNPESWKELLRIISRKDLIGDTRFDTPARRAEREAEVDSMIAVWTSQHTKHEAMRILGGAGIPAGAVMDTWELQNDPTFEARGMMQKMPHPANDEFKMLTWPVLCDGKSAALTPAPSLGEHTPEILRTWLGIEALEIDALRTAGVI